MMKRMVIAVTMVCVVVVLGASVHSVYAGGACTMGFYSIAPSFAPVNTSMAKMKAFLEKESNGGIEMNLFPAGQLGPESAGLNKLKIGAVQTAAITGVAISTIEPKANILMMPYVFRTWDDVEKFANGEVMAEIGRSLEKKGLKLMGIGSYGFFNILSVKGCVTGKEDLKGIKIRVYPTPVLVDLYKILGATPTPIAFPEIYTGLQQGVIEATDGTLDSSHASKQYEVAKFLTRTDHIHAWFLFLANKRWFDELPRETRDLIQEGFKRYSPVAREESRNYDEKILKIYEEEGVEIKVFTEQERQAFKEATAPIHDKYRDSIGADFMDTFYKELNYK